jgi:hypothetical protein
MITCLIISYILFRFFGKSNVFKKETVKVPVNEQVNENTVQ